MDNNNRFRQHCRGENSSNRTRGCKLAQTTRPGSHLFVVKSHTLHNKHVKNAGNASSTTINAKYKTLSSLSPSDTAREFRENETERDRERERRHFTRCSTSLRVPLGVAIKAASDKEFKLAKGVEIAFREIDPPRSEKASEELG